MVHSERIFRYNNIAYQSGCIVYWMQREQRTKDNWALIFAQEQAIEVRQPLYVIFNKVPEFAGASYDHFRFMLAGLKAVGKSLDSLSIPFTMLSGDPVETIPRFLAGKQAGFLITDFNPLRQVIQWKTEINSCINVPFVEVDAHNVFPVRTISDHREYSAFTLRKKIDRRLNVFLEPFPRLINHPFPGSLDFVKNPGGEFPEEIGNYKIEGADYKYKSGEHEAAECLTQFLNHGLSLYQEQRNSPEKNGQSGLSPYLHFGQISAQRIALEIRAFHVDNPGAAPFLEELIVRRELADNFCFYCNTYDSVKAFQPWAFQTLDKHRNDPRSYLYDETELEQGLTHDPLWNASQREMRMYWAKKILEWTESPEQAMDIAVYLNDKYSLDGRDPNGYAGIAWAIGGVHDRPWSERPVFGMIRYMNYEGCNRKFNIREYIRKVNSDM
jgi:deoxyribodipyrimidine photo-lyase